MSLHQIAKIADYVRYLRENSQESGFLFKELLIGVTTFFRDPSVWDKLKDKVFPEFLAAHPRGGIVRAWTIGCSTGEEAYSLAIIFKEVLDKLQPAKNFSLQIFATDLDKDSINKARQGVYPANIRADVSESRLHRFFNKGEHGDYSVKKEIRETVILAPHNLVMDPPFTKLDFLTCRNLLIYLDGELQKKLIPLFHYSLNPGGILLLGTAETIGTASNLFAPLAGRSGLYRRLEIAQQASLSEFPSAGADTRFDTQVSSTAPSKAPLMLNVQAVADRLLLQRYSPSAVLVTKEGDILYVSGKTGKYLEPAMGKANWNIFAMCREGLSNALAEAFHKAVRKEEVVTLKGLSVRTNGDMQVVDITVHPVTSPETFRGMLMVIFTDVAEPPTPELPASLGKNATDNSRATALARELRRAREALQAARDEMQISQEELKSTNEELQAMNEELQSTNEELTTSKEEMQSMNEELQTVNHELQAKVNELSRTSNDMENLLNSTEIATLFLDDTLLVRRFTTRTASIIKLIPADIGRPITDIATTLDYPELAEDIQEVLKTLVFAEKQIYTRDQRWFNVRIMPYRTQENRIDGVVITFTDVTLAKNLEIALRKAQADLEERFTRQTTELDQTQKNLRTEINRRPRRNARAGPAPASDHKPRESRNEGASKAREKLG